MADHFASWGYSLKKQTPWSNDKTIIELGYCKISWFVNVSQINYLPQPSALANTTDLLTTDKSRYFAQPHPIIVNCSFWVDLLWKHHAETCEAGTLLYKIFYYYGSKWTNNIECWENCIICHVYIFSAASWLSQTSKKINSAWFANNFDISSEGLSHDRLACWNPWEKVQMHNTPNYAKNKIPWKVLLKMFYLGGTGNH